MVSECDVVGEYFGFSERRGKWGGGSGYGVLGRKCFGCGFKFEVNFCSYRCGWEFGEVSVRWVEWFLK